ncbi:hypothetical protein GH714_009184 [Hevea brasiliensis]|uniref:Pentacotripeptide-repeat region of PRORP domain-containing protein n=1 Tax=Hevea brasiliensis TaxID=3981 RepID=A0A6A6N368_HEVBR|nr:hypothetical protein GH714_009184 [Hevea brasiliensis]
MEGRPENIPNPQSLTESQVLETLTNILTSEKVPLQNLSPYIPHLSSSPNLIVSLLSSKALSHRPTTLLSFFKWAQTHLPPSISQSPLPLLSLLPPLLSHHKFSDAKSLLTSFIAADKTNVLHRHILHPPAGVEHTRTLRALLDTSIGAYVGSGRPHHAAQIFSKMKRLRLKPNLLTSNTLLNALVRYPSSHSVYLSKAIFSDVIKLGAQVNTNTFNILIYGCCLENKLGEAIGLIGKMAEFGCSPDNVTYNTILDVLCRIDEALRLRDEMENLKLFPDVVTYNTLINGCFECNNSPKAFGLIEEMEQKGVKLEAATYNILVKWYANEGSMDDAGKIIRAMEESGFSPNSVTYNTLISVHCKVGKLGEAIRMMNEGKESKRGYFVDEVSYGTLIMGYFKDEKPDKALKLWDEMKEKEIIPGIITYNSMIGGLCQSEKTDQAIDKLNELLESGLVPDETTYNTIIHGYCREGQVEKAFQFHNKMIDNSFKPDVFTFTYNTIIASLCKNGRFEEAFDLLAEMEEKKLGPDCYTYNAIIGGLANAGRIKEAEEFASKIVEMGKLQDQTLPLKKGQQMRASETPEESDPNSITFSEKINELCTQGKYKDAMQTFQESTQKGITLHKSTYIKLMEGLIKRRKSISKTTVL